MRLKLTIEYAGTRYSGWQIQKNARTVQGEMERAVTAATGRARLRALGVRPHRRRRPRARAGGAPRHSHDDSTGDAAPPHQRRAACRYQRPAHREGAPQVPRPARRRRTQLHLSGLTPPHRVCQALRLVGEGRSRSRADAGGCGALRRLPRLPVVLRRRSARRSTEVSSRHSTSSKTAT